jgi:phage-related protein
VLRNKFGQWSQRTKATTVRVCRWVEIAINDESGTWRAVYTVSIGDSIYVIHAFQMKSKFVIATPKSEIELIQQRLKQLRSEVRNAEKKNSRNGTLFQ